MPISECLWNTTKWCTTSGKEGLDYVLTLSLEGERHVGRKERWRHGGWERKITDSHHYLAPVLLVVEQINTVYPAWLCSGTSSTQTLIIWPSLSLQHTEAPTPSHLQTVYTPCVCVNLCHTSAHVAHTPHIWANICSNFASLTCYLGCLTALSEHLNGSKVVTLSIWRLLH